MQITDENIRKLKEVVRCETPRLLRLPGVLSVGVALKRRNGVSTETLCVRVTVKKKKPVEPENTNEQRIDDVIRVQGYPVDVIEIEDKVEPSEPRICNVPESEARTGTYDVLKGGIGIYSEHDGVKQPYGTLGMIVYDHKSGQPMILTTRNVLGSLSITKNGVLEHTESLYQGTTSIPVGEAHRSDFDYDKRGDHLKYTSDFLIAKPVGDREVSEDVEGIEFERIYLEPKLGMNVWKSGARTGITQGVITQIDGYAFQVGGKSTLPFACEGDTGAIVFGEQENVKRPVGIVTGSGVESIETYCLSLRPALVNNPWLDIGLDFEYAVDEIHRFWNPTNDSTYYGKLRSGNLDDSVGLMYEYKSPAFIGANPYDLKSIPLYSWLNSVSKKHFYSTSRIQPALEAHSDLDLMPVAFSTSKNENNTFDYFYTGKSCFVNKSSKYHKISTQRKDSNVRKKFIRELVSFGKQIRLGKPINICSQKKSVNTKLQVKVKNAFLLIRDPTEHHSGLLIYGNTRMKLGDGLYALYHKVKIDNKPLYNKIRPRDDNDKVIQLVRKMNGKKDFKNLQPDEFICIPSFSTIKKLLEIKYVPMQPYVIDFLENYLDGVIDVNKLIGAGGEGTIPIITTVKRLRLYPAGNCFVLVEAQEELLLIVNRRINSNIVVNVNVTDIASIGSLLISTVGLTFEASFRKLEVRMKKGSSSVGVGFNFNTLETTIELAEIIHDLKLADGSEVKVIVKGKCKFKVLPVGCVVKTIPTYVLDPKYIETPEFLRELAKTLRLSPEEIAAIILIARSTAQVAGDVLRYSKYLLGAIAFILSIPFH